MWRATPVIVGVILAIVMRLSLSFLDQGVWRGHHTVGTVMVIPAFVLWTCARYQLGAAFTARAEARSLVTSGLYSRIRHPIYLSAELLLAGLCIFLGYPALWLASLAFLPAQLNRARREERVLGEAFKEEYQVYLRRTWF
jgi:protein-S-isoprenylcysteine O-methyltransferase Ste14